MTENPCPLSTYWYGLRDGIRARCRLWRGDENLGALSGMLIFEQIDKTL
jgi:hypothetical protein